MAYFVYVSWNGRVEAQRFDQWPTRDGKPLEVLQSHEITGRDMQYRISFLIKKYPYKEKPDLT